MATRHMACLLALLALFLAPAAGRQLLAANATAGAPAQPPANILFTVSGARATLTTDALRLVNVAPVVQFYTAQSNAGVYRTGDFANSSAGGMFVTASGAWLTSPVGVLKAFDSAGNATSALLTLAEPRYDAATHTLSFKTTLLQPTTADARLKTAGGASHRLINDAENGLTASVLTEAPAGALTGAALFIDQNAQTLKETASAENFWRWGWGGGWGGGWGRGGWGGGWGGPWWG